jgi:hypothetical protein
MRRSSASGSQMGTRLDGAEQSKRTALRRRLVESSYEGLQSVLP